MMNPARSKKNLEYVTAESKNVPVLSLLSTILSHFSPTRLDNGNELYRFSDEIRSIIQDFFGKESAEVVEQMVIMYYLSRWGRRFNASLERFVESVVIAPFLRKIFIF